MLELHRIDGIIAGQAIELALSGDQRPELIPMSRDLKPVRTRG